LAHIPVLLEEAVHQLVQSSDGIYVDGTFGRGGHASLILSKLSLNARLIVMDKDPLAIATAQKMMSTDSRVMIAHQSFSQIQATLGEACAGQVTGVLLDLGVSSPQLDEAERGFSFMNDGPLDMRMNPDQGETAAAWLARVSFAELREALKTFGEERKAGRIAALPSFVKRLKHLARSEKRDESRLGSLQYGMSRRLQGPINLLTLLPLWSPEAVLRNIQRREPFRQSVSLSIKS